MWNLKQGWRSGRATLRLTLASKGTCTTRRKKSKGLELSEPSISWEWPWAVAQTSEDSALMIRCWDLRSSEKVSQKVWSLISEEGPLLTFTDASKDPLRGLENWDLKVWGSQESEWDWFWKCQQKLKTKVTYFFLMKGSFLKWCEGNRKQRRMKKSHLYSSCIPVFF